MNFSSLYVGLEAAFLRKSYRRGSAFNFCQVMVEDVMELTDTLVQYFILAQPHFKLCSFKAGARNNQAISCSNMALLLPPGLTPSETAFLCEMEMVTVIPRQRLEGLNLLGVS